MIKSTLTILDIQQERKDLLLEINKLKEEKEILKQEVKDYSNTKTAILNEMNGGLSVSELKDLVSSNIKIGFKKEIKDLTDIREIYQIDLENKKRDFNDLKSSLSQLDSDKEKKIQELEKLNKEIEKDLENKKREESILDSNIEELSVKVKKLTKTRIEEEENINNLQKDFKDRQEFLLKEEERLSKKGSDLAIYEARLRKKYLELMPEMEIVL